VIRSWVIYVDNVPSHLSKAQQAGDALKQWTGHYLNGEKVTAVDALIAPLADLERLIHLANYEWIMYQISVVQGAQRDGVLALGKKLGH
jgi:hypothetical protein